MARGATSEILMVCSLAAPEAANGRQRLLRSQAAPPPAGWLRRPQRQLTRSRGLRNLAPALLPGAAVLLSTPPLRRLRQLLGTAAGPREPGCRSSMALPATTRSFANGWPECCHPSPPRPPQQAIEWKRCGADLRRNAGDGCSLRSGCMRI